MLRDDESYPRNVIVPRGVNRRGPDRQRLFTHGSLDRPRESDNRGEDMDQFVAQLERQPDGVLVAVLYVNGGRADSRPVRSVRQGKRRAHDMLCAAVDAQVNRAAAVDRARRTAHVELVP